MPDTEQVATATILEAPKPDASAATQTADGQVGANGTGAPSGAEAQVEQIDWKARAEAAEKLVADVQSAKEKAEQNLRSEQGNSRKAQRELEMLRAELTPADTRSRAAEVTAARAEATTLNRDPDAAEQSVRKSHADEDNQRMYQLGQALVAERDAALAEVGLNWDAPALRPVRVNWRFAWRLGDVDTVKELIEQIRETPPSATKSPTSAETRAQANGAKPVAEAPGAKPLPNMDTGRGVGAGAESLQTLVNRLARGAVLNPDEMAKARKAMDEQNIYPD